MCTHSRIFACHVPLQRRKKILGTKSQTQRITEVKIMANRKRNIQMKFDVTAEERELIHQKMAQLPTKQIGAYLRKMAIDGLIVYTDTSDIRAFTKELHAIGLNINQIAKRVNATGSVYETDIAEIKEGLTRYGDYKDASY